MNKNARAVDVSLLPILIDYDPATGDLRWKVRTPDVFKGCPRRSPESACAVWNGSWAGKRAFARRTQSGHFHGTLFDIIYPAHRVAWAIYYGEWPAIALDHIDGNPANNRIDNLRLANAETNARNRGLSADNKSGFLGVYWCKTKGLWTAAITDKYRKITLGAFASKAEAVAARIGAERVLNYHENHGKRPSTMRLAAEAGSVEHHHRSANT